MGINNETYRQKSFFQTGMPLFGAALFVLIVALYFCLRRGTLLLAVSLLAIGLLLMLLGTKRVKGEAKHILRFVQEKSVFCHRCVPPLTVTGLLECLKQEGFEVTEYPFGNYYCHRNIGQKHSCHFFVANNDTPDCPEAESYSELFIRTVCEAGIAFGSQYLLDLEYGPGLEQTIPQYIQAAREGFMHDKDGVFFGFKLAYDTREDILYCAEAVTRVIWQKSETPAIYASELLKRLFLLTGCIKGGEYGDNLMQTFDDLQNAEYHGGPFENNLDSARAYLLEQMQEKYGIEFTVVGDEDLVNYGPLAGATYTCEVAPSDTPEQETTAFVSQTQYQEVRDNYAMYFFKKEVEEQAILLCTETEYVQSYEISLKMLQTAGTWDADDDINAFLKTSDAYLDLKVFLETGKSDEEYADLILDFLEKAYGLNANVKLSVLEAEHDYIFWSILNVLDGMPPQLPTKEKIIEDMEIARMM